MEVVEEVESAGVGCVREARVRVVCACGVCAYAVSACGYAGVDGGGGPIQ